MSVTIIRPGAVWGGDDLWDGGTGQIVGPVWLAAGDGVTAKFTYVENCAEAIVLAAERPEAVGETINVVDDERPTQRQYAQLLRDRGIAVPRAVPVPFTALRAAVGVLDKANRRFAGGRAKLPSMLVARHLDARFKPFEYTNEKAKRLLGWRPRYTVAEGLDRSLARRSRP
jgi:2-alkyl-3-oxoalkanoate reductase